MKKCLRIRISGNVQESNYKVLVQKEAHNLGIEGSFQAADEESVVIYACGSITNLERFIDILYKGTASSAVNDLIAEPLMNERNFRGVFRLIGD